VTCCSRIVVRTSQLQLLLAHLAGRAITARVELEDLLQEVYLRVLSGSSEVPAEEEGEAPLFRYLTRVARNTVVDAARAIRARKRDGNESPLVHSDWSHVGVRASHLAAATPGPFTRAGLAETEARLVAAFRSLSGEHRRILGLRQFEGLSARETAERTGRSEAAVHSLYRRALQAWSEASG